MIEKDFLKQFDMYVRETWKKLDAPDRMLFLADFAERLHVPVSVALLYIRSLEDNERETRIT